MPRHQWSILCTKATIDQYSQELSLLGVIETLGIGTTDPSHPAMGEILAFPSTLVSMWHRDNPEVPENAEARVMLVAPDGARAAGKSLLKIQLQNHVRTRTLLGMPQMEFRGPGAYRFDIELRRAPDGPWELAGSVPLDVTVTVTKPAPAEPAHEP